MHPFTTILLLVVLTALAKATPQCGIALYVTTSPPSTAPLYPGQCHAFGPTGSVFAQAMYNQNCTYCEFWGGLGCKGDLVWEGGLQEEELVNFEKLACSYRCEV